MEKDLKTPRNERHGSKKFFGKKATYHWHDEVDEFGRLLNHRADNTHAEMKHFQIQDENDNVF